MSIGIHELPEKYIQITNLVAQYKDIEETHIKARFYNEIIT